MESKVLKELYEYEDLPEFIKNNDIEHEQDELDLDVALYPMGFMKKTKVITQKVIQILDDGTMPTLCNVCNECRKRYFF